MKRLFLLFNMTHFFTGGGLFFPWQRESPTTVMFGDIRSETTLLIWDPTNCNWLDMKRSTYALYHSSLLTGTTSLAAGSPLGHLQIDSYLQWSNTIITVLTALFVCYDHQLEHLPKESSPPHAPAGLWVAPGWYCLIWLILGMVMMITRKMTIMVILIMVMVMIKTKHLLVSSGRSARLHSWSGKLWEEK